MSRRNNHFLQRTINSHFVSLGMLQINAGLFSRLQKMKNLSLRQRPFLRLFGVLCLIWFLLNLPVLLGIRVLPWDAQDAFYPTVFFNAHTLRQGLAPWWNPYIYSGYPQIADPQGMLFSPLLMAWMLLRSAPGATWFDWGVLLHVLMGGTAMMSLLRRSNANAFGALIGATVFIAGGVAAARLEHTPILIAYAYAPLALLSLRHFMAAPDWRRGVLLGLVSGGMITQLVQVTYLFVLVTVTYAVFGTALHWRNYSQAERWRWCVGVVMAVLFALALGLPQVLFSWAYTSLSNRALLPLIASAPASLDWRAALSVFDPNAMHALRGTYSGPASKVEAYLYIGAIPTLLLIGVSMAWRRVQQRRQLWFFAAVAIFASLYAAGTNTWFYPWLYGWLPGMQHFRRPSDAAYLLIFSFAMFTGLSASHFKLDSRRQVNLLLGVAMCWLALSSSQMLDDGVRWQAATLMAAILALFALWRLRLPGSTQRTAVWLLLILVADYRCFNLNGSFNQSHDGASSFMHDATARFLVKRLQVLPGMLSPRVETLDAGPRWDNNVALRGIHSTQGYNPLRYSLYDQWYGARDNGGLPRVNTRFNAAPNSKLNDLLGVEYLVRGVASRDRPWSLPSGYARVFTDASTEVWQNSLAYPQWLNPTRTIALPTQQLPSPSRFDATDFRRTVWLTPRDADDQRAGESLATTCTARITIADVRVTPTQLSMRTQSFRAGWLVLSELDFPGWVANADGVNLAIHRVNGMFRAVCVPAGDHALRFVFHPWTMVADAWRQRTR